MQEEIVRFGCIDGRKGADVLLNDVYGKFCFAQMQDLYWLPIMGRARGRAVNTPTKKILNVAKDD